MRRPMEIDRDINAAAQFMHKMDSDHSSRHLVQSLFLHQWVDIWRQFLTPILFKNLSLDSFKNKYLLQQIIYKQ